MLLSELHWLPSDNITTANHELYPATKFHNQHWAQPCSTKWGNISSFYWYNSNDIAVLNSKVIKL